MGIFVERGKSMEVNSLQRTFFFTKFTFESPITFSDLEIAFIEYATNKAMT